jgi:hypothetical protein
MDPWELQCTIFERIAKIELRAKGDCVLDDAIFLSLQYDLNLLRLRLTGKTSINVRIEKNSFFDTPRFKSSSVRFPRYYVSSMTSRSRNTMYPCKPFERSHAIRLFTDAFTLWTLRGATRSLCFAWRVQMSRLRWWSRRSRECGGKISLIFGSRRQLTMRYSPSHNRTKAPRTGSVA